MIQGIRKKYDLTHKSWYSMRQRVLNKKHTYYKNYGAKNITICEEWNTFDRFKEDMGERPGPEFSIDRIDNNGSYSKENCRWATRSEQAANRKTSRFVIYKNKKMCLKHACIEIGIGYRMLWKRIFLRGHQLNKAINLDASIIKWAV